jgi:hypothetical protein
LMYSGAVGNGVSRMRELTSLAESDRKIALDRYRILQLHLRQAYSTKWWHRSEAVTFSDPQLNALARVRLVGCLLERCNGMFPRLALCCVRDGLPGG